MQSLRKILVSIKDPTARSAPGLVKAAGIAAACGAELELFHDIATPVCIEALADRGGGLAVLQREVRKAALEGLERLAKPLRNRGLTASVAAEWDFPPYEAIVRRAERIGAQLIVSQRHASHRIAGLLGYTDWALLRESPVPVLLVKSARAYRQPVILAAIDPRHAHAKPSGLDTQILMAGATLAQELHGKLHVVHAYQTLAMPIFDVATDYSWMTTEAAARIRKSARTAFGHILSRSTIPESCRHLVAADPVMAIPALARRLRSSIVVIGAVSRSGLKRLFIGNTAERVIDALSCDLLVVKPVGFRNRISRVRRGFQFITTPI
jgi:universal stress protein E